MENIRCLEYVLTTIALYATNLIVYLCFNKGLARNAKGLQTRRYLIASVISVLPIAVAQVPVTSRTVIFNALLAIVCGTAFPVIYHLSNRKQSTGHDNHIDLVLGIYLFGWFTSLQIVAQSTAGIAGGILATTLCIIIGIVAFAISLFPIIQWGHYFLYKTGFNTDSIQTIQNTYFHEILEFSKSFPKAVLLTIVLAICATLGLCIWGELGEDAGAAVWGALFAAAWAIGFTKYLWIGRRSLLFRTGLVLLYLDVQEYVQGILRYNKEMANRLKDLELKLLNRGENEAPHTFVLVIGESASREYMSAYTEMEQDTTPWLKECMKDEAHHVVFKNAYACANQTVPTLERALTERNQYNDKEFYESLSIVDIARKAGYTINWYSNQSYIGVYDTSITLVAKTADTAKWVKLEGNRLQYDESLLLFLDEVDPTKNNLVVLHLKGSHFNFINRYPAEATQWGEPGVQDNILNYMNSIHYTDSLLKRVYEYAKERLNLQAMLYFSDHGCIPDKRRLPQFDGFAFLHIPLSIHFTDSYISAHKERFDALKANKDKFFTNDLVYELFCGLLDIESNHFEKENSLAYKEYKYTLDMLLTNSGQTKLSKDSTIGML